MGSMNRSDGFLPSLTRAFKSLDSEAQINTRAFVEAVEAILPVFDDLGTVFHFAKSEMEAKRATLVSVQESLRTLDEVVKADVKAGTVTTKNSGARNLSRLLSGVAFIAGLLQRLAADPAVSLREAANEAYSSTLAPIHTYLVRAAIRASMFLLPDRTAFLKSIGESEDSARAHAAALDRQVARCRLLS
ncbi:hypothetical protein WJX81_006404 [Elliptochloris bilobata]|uniref:Glycolipid transfer protein domain-containing protein n=1 Tax=Elliptochloris bilobata TaxID=381761 RepID=A0AAW1S236_9CHLO